MNKPFTSRFFHGVFSVFHTPFFFKIQHKKTRFRRVVE